MHHCGVGEASGAVAHLKALRRNPTPSRDVCWSLESLLSSFCLCHKVLGHLQLRSRVPSSSAHVNDVILARKLKQRCRVRGVSMESSNTSVFYERSKFISYGHLG